MSERTVAQAEQEVAALTGDAAKVADLIAVCLNAEATFSMMGVKADRGKGFKRSEVLTLTQIEDLLATMPDEVGLVKASMAFACEMCGKPAETGNDDCWICDDCLAKAPRV
jgi:hypothetical protein